MKPATDSRRFNTQPNLRPDIILLDIGMPVLHGLAAARQILRAFPHSKIVFVTQNTDFEMMEEARAVGAVGYVVKTDALSELVPAIEAALRDGHRGNGSFSA